MKQILKMDILASKNDPQGNDSPRIDVFGDRVEITTRLSVDPDHASTGGDYTFWVEYSVLKDGRVVRKERCSSTIWQPEEEEVFDVNMTFENMVDLINKGGGKK